MDNAHAAPGLAERVATAAGTPRLSPAFLVVAGFFIACLIVANIIAVKLVLIFGVVMPAGVIIFPLSYLFGDVLTEVYGYARSRLIIWLGFACNALVVVAIVVAGYFAWQRREDQIAAQQAAALAQGAQQQTMTPKQMRRARADENAKLGMMICAMELVSAKNMGVIPPYGQLADSQPRLTAKKGRLSCQAATQVTKYEIQADLVCRTLVNPNCMKLHSVKTDDGTVLYENKS